jgi:hypothetical protein
MATGLPPRRLQTRPPPAHPDAEDGDGHPNETGRDDQTCWRPGHYVEASTEEILTEYNRRTDTWNTWASRVGVMAYRGFNQHPSVYVHIDLPAYADGIDVPVTLTNEEARNWRRISLRLLSC